MKHATSLVLLPLVMLLASPRLLAQEAEPAQPQEVQVQEAPRIDPQAEQVLRRQAEFFTKAGSLTFQVNTSMKMEGEGMKQEVDMAQGVAMQRPNKLAIQPRRGMGATIISDGEKMYVQVPGFGKYIEKPAPATLDALLEDESGMFLGGGGGGIGEILAILFADDPYAQMIEDVQTINYNGSEELDGVAHHRLQVVEDEVTTDVWIQAGEQPLIRRLVPDMSKFMEQMAEMNPQMGQMKMEVSVEFVDWQIDQPIPAERFTFTPPQDAQRVASVAEMLGGGPGAGGEEAAHAALLGRPAPQVELDLLDGGQMSLAQHKDKDIVIMDFWATWCGPCIQAMPSLMEVAEEYKDRNVVFYAVNLRERPQQVQRFLEQREWSLRVPMDTDGSVADLFGVTGIPQTVIIGKDGVVEAVHVGFMPGLKERLSGELDTLLEGKRLAERE